MHLYGQTHYSRDYVDKSAVLKVSVIKTNEKKLTHSKQIQGSSIFLNQNLKCFL